MVTATTPYQTFAKVLSNYHDRYSDPGPSSSQLDSPIHHQAVLDEEGGLINALMASLQETITSKSPTNNSTFEMDGEDQISEEEYKALLSEHRTWQLVRAVYENRINRADPAFVPPSSRDQILANPYASPEDVLQAIVMEDDELSLWAVLVEHLQTRPLLTSPPPLETRHGYLPSTLRRTKTARPPPGTSHPTSLDPDFTLRDPHGPGLAGEDQTYQSPLLETLYDLVRHGELDVAIKVCEQGGEAWRGASIMGGRRWNMGGMSKDSLTPTPIEGNRYRALWKKSCRALASNHTLLPAERHLYAALISDLPTLLPACTSWEDHLWAHVQHRIEARVERRWKELGGYWEQEGRGLGGEEEEGESEVVRGGLEEVFESMAGLQKPGVAMMLSDPYHIAQRAILLGTTDSLFESFADNLLSLEGHVSAELIGALLRFFTHLALILRTLNQPLPDAAVNYIIQAYLQVLEREGNDKLVAMYAACLREGSGEESYARFLWSMDPSATKEARAEALNRAKQHNLDVALIAKETVRLTLQEAIGGTHFASTQPDIVPVSVGLTERDVVLIRAIEWLTILDETIVDALVESNRLVRHFLSLGQANAAQSLLLSLPPNLLLLLPASPNAPSPTNDPDSHLLEHASFNRLFTVFTSYHAVSDVLASQPKSTAGKVERFNWSKGLRSAVLEVWDRTLGLVKEGWLAFPTPRPSASADKEARAITLARTADLTLIRHIFIPDLILRLHALLVTHSAVFPEFLAKALELAVVVADDEYGVYEGFLPVGGSGKGEVGGAEGSRLVVYLEKVREVGLLALKSGSGSAFKVGAA
ncbi:hypothetical protein IAT38_006873 [Cryptococcus sp. DSM 104549]